MSNNKLYSTYKITYQDYQHYKTIFLDTHEFAPFESEILSRLKLIKSMLKEEHKLFSDASIREINQKVKKELLLSRRLLLCYGICASILFYFGLQYLKPRLGLNLYNMPKFYNHPFDLLLLALIMFIAWYYEKRAYQKNLYDKTKSYLIAEVEKHYTMLEDIRKKEESRKRNRRNHNKKRKKRK